MFEQTPERNGINCEYLVKTCAPYHVCLNMRLLPVQYAIQWAVIKVHGTYNAIKTFCVCIRTKFTVIYLRCNIYSFTFFLSASPFLAHAPNISIQIKKRLSFPNLDLIIKSFVFLFLQDEVFRTNCQYFDLHFFSYASDESGRNHTFSWKHISENINVITFKFHTGQ